MWASSRLLSNLYPNQSNITTRLKFWTQRSAQAIWAENLYWMLFDYMLFDAWAKCQKTAEGIEHELFERSTIIDIVSSFRTFEILPQSSVLLPLLFNCYISKLSQPPERISLICWWLHDINVRHWNRWHMFEIKKIYQWPSSLLGLLNSNHIHKLDERV